MIVCKRISKQQEKKVEEKNKKNSFCVLKKVFKIIKVFSFIFFVVVIGWFL